eukprot:m.63169 g.63169  ORF g.63169 m.63169 type:complete len:239 (+) comp9651_c0_seq1:1486-2202(+)
MDQLGPSLLWQRTSTFLAALKTGRRRRLERLIRACQMLLLGCPFRTLHACKIPHARRMLTEKRAREPVDSFTSTGSPPRDTGFPSPSGYKPHKRSTVGDTPRAPRISGFDSDSPPPLFDPSGPVLQKSLAQGSMPAWKYPDLPDPVSTRNKENRAGPLGPTPRLSNATRMELGVTPEGDYASDQAASRARRPLAAETPPLIGQKLTRREKRRPTDHNRSKSAASAHSHSQGTTRPCTG